MNIKEVKELIRMLDGTDIVEFNYESEGSKLIIKKGHDVISHVTTNHVPVATVPAVAPIAMPAAQVNYQAPPQVAEEKNEGLGPNQVYIPAPMVGTFYAAPSPESDPYVQVGQVIEVGQVVCIIEAMKLMNEIESEWRGKIVDILVENAQPVEFGQPLFILEKT